MLHVDRIAKSFGTLKVLNNISFSIKNGEIYGLIGKNGAGKTTLLNIIAGLSSPDDGLFSIEEMENATNGIGYLPDIPAFFDYLSSQEYMDFLLMNTSRANSKRSYLLQMVGLHGNEKIKAMSRGMRQRLGIAAALVTDPQILLLDEPTSALDPQGRHELMEILKQLKASGHSIVLSTHILTDMEKVCDRVGFLHDGIIKKEIDMGTFLNGERNVWEIIFESTVSLLPHDEAMIHITQVDNKTYYFETINQKYLLQYLINLSAPIATIKNKVVSLDDLFEEVCK